MMANPKSIANLALAIIEATEAIDQIQTFSDEEIAAAFKTAAAAYDQAIGAGAQRAMFANMLNKR